jgi:AcrR family transcriptional regulator
MSSEDSNTRQRILAETWRLVEQHLGRSVRISDIARAAGISRQAVYLHFNSRTELLVATVRYVDQVHGLDDRLAGLRSAVDGVETLQLFVDFWGSYIPEIYGLARALLVARETDPAAAAAWEDRMKALREGCRCVIECLEREQLLVQGWNIAEGADFLYGMLSVSIWENLTIERGWTKSQYLTRMHEVLRRIFVKNG